MNTLADALANAQNYHKAGGGAGGMLVVVAVVLWLAFGSNNRSGD